MSKDEMWDKTNYFVGKIKYINNREADWNDKQSALPPLVSLINNIHGNVIVTQSPINVLFNSSNKCLYSEHLYSLTLSDKITLFNIFIW